MLRHDIYLSPGSFDLLNPNGVCEAQGFAEVSFNLLSISTQAMSVFDVKGEKIGYIEFLQESTTSHPKYCFFFNDLDELICKAVLDDFYGFTIKTLDDKAVASMKRQSDLKHLCWEVDLIDTTVIDKRVLQLFSAYVIQARRSTLCISDPESDSQNVPAERGA